MCRSPNLRYNPDEKLSPERVLQFLRENSTLPMSKGFDSIPDYKTPRVRFPGKAFCSKTPNLGHRCNLFDNKNSSLGHMSLCREYKCVGLRTRGGQS